MNIKIGSMNSLNYSIEVLIAKYIDNQVSENEALTVLQLLSQSKELREVFCLATAGHRRMQGMRLRLYHKN